MKPLHAARGHAVPTTYGWPHFFSGGKMVFIFTVVGLAGFPVGFWAAGLVLLFHVILFLFTRNRRWAWTEGGAMPSPIMEAWGRQLITLCHRRGGSWYAVYHLIRNSNGEWSIHNSEGICVQVIQTLETAKRYTMARGQKETDA